MTKVSGVDDRFMTLCERDSAMETVEDRQWDSDANLREEDGRLEKDPSNSNRFLGDTYD